jgi:hypothetical protein
MMVPFDGSAPQQQQQGVAPAPLPRPPMPPGHQPGASPAMHQQQMHNPYGMQRQPSLGGASQGYPNQLPPGGQSPGSRQNSFGMPQQGHYSSHPPLHSPAHQQQQQQQQQQGGMHSSIPQMHRNSAQQQFSNPGNMGMQSMPQQHEQMRTPSTGYMNNPMNNQMSNSMGMNNSMNSMGNPMSNSMNNTMNTGMGNSMSNSMGNNMMGQPQQQQQQQQQRASMSSSGLNGNWQTDKDTPHRREMIQHMYVYFHSR